MGKIRYIIGKVNWTARRCNASKDDTIAPRSWRIGKSDIQRAAIALVKFTATSVWRLPVQDPIHEENLCLNLVGPWDCAKLDCIIALISSNSIVAVHELAIIDVVSRCITTVISSPAAFGSKSVRLGASEGIHGARILSPRPRCSWNCHCDQNWRSRRDASLSTALHPLSNSEIRLFGCHSDGVSL